MSKRKCSAACRESRKGVAESEPEVVSPGGSEPKIPANKRVLRSWIRKHFRVTLADEAVCFGHHAPWTIFTDLYFQRPSIALVLGPRGGGKSFLSALHTHLVSRRDPRHGTRILGGSLSQSEQVYRALADLSGHGWGAEIPEDEAIAKLLKDRALYKNGSDVQILAASRTSVRGPHVPSLKLDEVDEIDTDCREAAMGMCMNRRGISASVLMTSTWHKVGGPMEELMERAEKKDFPFYKFCIFEVLEKCPDSRSGKELEKCPECALKKWCHADREQDPKGRPKAKRSNGHYSIDSVIQKIRATSQKTFEADYLCLGPKREGIWFAEFDPATHVSSRGEFDPYLPVHLAVDTGVTTGAVMFQVSYGAFGEEEVRVFADYLAEDVSALQNARALRELAKEWCRGVIDKVTTDPAGNSRTANGPTVVAEYERGGLVMQPWPRGSVVDGLTLLGSFLEPASGGLPAMVIHPRCIHLIRSLQNYRRAKRGGQWSDQPEDPQHPFEDLVDALRGGLRACFPEGRRPRPSFPRLSARSVF